MAQRLLERAASMLRGLQAVRPLITSQLLCDSIMVSQPAVLAGLSRHPLPSLVACSAAQAAVPICGRGFAANAAAKAGPPQFVGGKMRTYTSYKERFRVTGTGKVRYNKPGHRHKRWVKGPRRNRRLRGENILTDAYARVMRKMGFER